MAAVGAGERAVLSSRALRKRLGRRKTQRRRKQLTAAREACADAAKPLRSYIGMVAWEGISQEDEISMKNIMAKLRYERRQIDKMKL